MITQLRKADEESIQLAAKLLCGGQIVAIPTETVYGLAANAFNYGAVENIFKAKMRPQDNPLIVHISDISELDLVAQDIPDEAYALALEFWPGPLTIVLKKSSNIAKNVSTGLDTVGVRMPAHDVARSIISACGLPLAAPSANVSGSPSPTLATHVMSDLGGRIPLIIDGGECSVGIESTVVSIVGGQAVVLRPGFITPDKLEKVIGKSVQLAQQIERRLQKDEVPQSPGMKYKHYAPSAEITIISAEYLKFIDYIEKEYPKKCDNIPVILGFEDEQYPEHFCVVRYGLSTDAKSQASVLFKALRQLDEIKAKKVIARQPASGQLGFAVRNRLMRAAAFRQVQL